MKNSGDRGATKGIPLPALQTSDAGKSPSPKLRALNFRVPEAFHREFKTYAASRGISMLEVLQEMFSLLKAGNGKNK